MHVLAQTLQPQQVTLGQVVHNCGDGEGVEEGGGEGGDGALKVKAAP